MEALLTAAIATGVVTVELDDVVIVVLATSTTGVIVVVVVSDEFVSAVVPFSPSAAAIVAVDAAAAPAVSELATRTGLNDVACPGDTVDMLVLAGDTVVVRVVLLYSAGSVAFA